MSDKRKYKVIHPTNGYNEGDIVELTEAEAANYNGGEPEPRVALVEEGSEATPPAGEGESGAGGEGGGGATRERRRRREGAGVIKRTFGHTCRPLVRRWRVRSHKESTNGELTSS